MSQLSGSKKEIRADLLLKRKALSQQACRLKSREITKRFLTSPEFKSARTIHFYLAAPVEVQTEEMIRETLRMGKRVVVPVIEPAVNRLILSELVDFDPSRFQPGPYGISEPRPEYRKKVDSTEVDLWVIPGVGFDAAGNRLGFGGGYYDRLLSGTSGAKIAVAFEIQVVDRLPIEKTDHPVDQIITETRTIHIKGEQGAGKKD